MANTNIQFYTDTATVFSTSDRQGKTSIGSATGTVQGLEIEYNLLSSTPAAFKISPSGINYTVSIPGIPGGNANINYTTPLARTAQVGSLIQSLETPPDATTLQVDKRILLNDGVSTGSIGISGVNTQVTSSGNLILDPVTNIVDLSGNSLDMGDGDIIDCPLIQSLNNNNIIVEGRGTGDIILKTGATYRLTISETGVMTFHGMSGSMGYNNATNTLTAANFDGTATKALLANNNTSGTFYPVFATGAGNQSLFVDNDTVPFSINPNLGIIRLSNTMKVADSRVAFGINAGVTNQGTDTVAIGNQAGQNNQGNNAVAIGINAGVTGQGTNSVAIGNAAGNASQQAGAVAIGSEAGYLTQGEGAVAIGSLAGKNNQQAGAIAIGSQAGQGLISGQGGNAIAIGNQAGRDSQIAGSICINASGNNLSPTLAGLFIRPIRAQNRNLGAGVLHYNTSTFEVTYSTA
jgi:hypothetical protein